MGTGGTVQAVDFVGGVQELCRCGGGVGKVWSMWAVNCKN